MPAAKATSISAGKSWIRLFTTSIATPQASPRDPLAAVAALETAAAVVQPALGQATARARAAPQIMTAQTRSSATAAYAAPTQVAAVRLRQLLALGQATAWARVAPLKTTAPTRSSAPTVNAATK